MKQEVITMSRKELNRYEVITRANSGIITVEEAAEALGITERQVTRLRNGVKKDGAAALIHKNRGKPTMRAISEEVKQKVEALYKSEIYTGANFLHFVELLAEHENIHLSYTTVRKTLNNAGIQSPKKRRVSKAHRTRKRKAQEGMLIQIDATPYEWFGGKTQYSLHGGIDDATNNITGLYMTKNECMHGYFEIMRQTIETKGIPISTYTDMHSIFRSPKADKLTIEEQIAGKQVNDTQFGRAMRELGITLIPARSPQAKGRIERLWDTLQSRLVIEFRRHNIKTVHEANAFFCDYITKFNDKFAISPEEVN